MDLPIATYSLPVLIVGGVVLYLLGIAIGIAYVRSAMEKRRRNSSGASGGDDQPARHSSPPARNEATGSDRGHAAISLELALTAYVVIALSGLVLGLVAQSWIVLGAASVSLIVGVLGFALVPWGTRRERPE